eukprot:SAG11_NODE_983_length_6306_cov_19.831319_5_plen_68_part_00
MLQLRACTGLQKLVVSYLPASCVVALSPVLTSCLKADLNCCTSAVSRPSNSPDCVQRSGSARCTVSW